MSDFRVAPASAADMRLLVEWAAAEGWNPGDGDVDAFFPTDPAGFLIGRLDGEPATAISAIRYGADFGFVGFYLTRPDLRGQGYGMRTWRLGLDRLAGRNVALDGVSAQQENYRRSGFRFAWATVRYQGVPAVEPVAGVTLVDGREIGFGDLAAYDRRFFPTARETFLAAWLTAPGHRPLAALRDGALVGLGVHRRAREGSRIGPLHADDPAVAATLLSALTDGGEIALDVPAVNDRAIDAAERFGLKPQWETARMYTGGVPAVDLTGIYGVTSLELG